MCCVIREARPTRSQDSRAPTGTDFVHIDALQAVDVAGGSRHHVLWRDQPSAPHQRAHVLAGAFVHGDAVVEADVAAANGTHGRVLVVRQKLPEPSSPWGGVVEKRNLHRQVSCQCQPLDTRTDLMLNSWLSGVMCR